MRHPELPVAGGFIELSPPPLGDAVGELVERGCAGSPPSR